MSANFDNQLMINNEVAFSLTWCFFSWIWCYWFSICIVDVIIIKINFSMFIIDWLKRIELFNVAYVKFLKCHDNFTKILSLNALTAFNFVFFELIIYSFEFLSKLLLWKWHVYLRWRLFSQNRCRLSLLQSRCHCESLYVQLRCALTMMMSWSCSCDDVFSVMSLSILINSSS